MSLRSLAITAAIVVSIGAVRPSMAQSSATLNLRETEDRAAAVPSLGLSVGEVGGMAVHGPTGERLGRVDEVLETRSGRVVAVSVQVGGLLGAGGQEVVLMLEQLRREDGRLVTGLTQAQLEAQPPWDN